MASISKADAYRVGFPEWIEQTTKKRSQFLLTATTVAISLLILLILFLHNDPVFASVAHLPGEDASDRLEAAGTLLKMLDTGIFQWGARIFAGLCIMSSAWALKEQRFGIAVICVVGAIIFGTAPKWVKNIFDIGDNQGIFSQSEITVPERYLAAKTEAKEPVHESQLAYLRGVLRARLPHPTERKVERLAMHIAKECEDNEIDPALVLAIIQVESDFKPNAISPKGALGLMQVMPGTARFVSDVLGVTTSNPSKLQDPYVNTRLGIAYLAWLRDRYAGEIPYMLSAYNAGPGRVDDKLKRQGRKYVPQVTREYIKAVVLQHSYFRSLGIEFTRDSKADENYGKET